MKKIKYVVICLILILIFLIAFERPILWRYYTSNVVEIEVKYSQGALLYSNDIETSDKSEAVQYKDSSDGIYIKLPNKSNIIMIKIETAKSTAYELKACIQRKKDYYFIFSCLLSHFPYNSKTHRGDILVALDNEGNEKYRCNLKSEEWLLDYNENIILIYNSSKNSFYCKDVNSDELRIKTIMDCDKYDRVVFECIDYDNSVWQALFYYGNDLIYKKSATIID